MKFQFLSIILILTGILACEETTTIDTDQAPTQLIIEGLITNELKQHTIKISQTVDFYQAGATPRVSGATVTVTEDSDNMITFNETSPGLYQPDEPFAGQIGSTYTMEVMVEGEAFTASEELLPVTLIDSLTYELNEDETEETERSVFSVFMYTVEPQDEDNYYLFKFYRNGEWLNEEGEDITVTDDTAIGEAIEGIEAPYLYFANDTARVEMYSLTREAFLFWNDVATLIFSDGGVFAPLPANPRTNISGNALGIFQVSALSAEDIVVQNP